jgi:5-methylcytosine-specific restriction endonuclease McrA
MRTSWNKGKSSWNKGKHLTEKHKQKIREAQEKENGNNWKGGISKDKEYKKKYLKEWKLKNRDKVYFSNRKRRNVKFLAEGSHTQGEWELLRKQYGFVCPYCKKKEPEIKLTEDHIIPLSKGGSDYIENIQPLCGRCNSIKNSKTSL